MELQNALAREKAWHLERQDLLQRQKVLARECDHRILNSLQLIVGFLSSQSLTASPEAAAQLTEAARRITAIGHVHQQLHLPDNRNNVNLKKYLQGLCDDISDVLFQPGTGHRILVEGAELAVPSLFAMPLGLITNELIINSAKYAEGNVTVRLETSPTKGHSLSVSDAGPGLPAGFDPASGKGLGMKIIQSLVQQIGGALHTRPGASGTGAIFAITFGN